MKVEDFDFNLPEELIAQTPLKDRTASRLLIVNPFTEEIEHRSFPHIVNELKKGDCLVLNDTRVMPARFWCKRRNWCTYRSFIIKTNGNDDDGKH